MRILLADDEAMARQRLQRLCEAQPDLAVVAVCADAQAVLEAIAVEPVDLALLDIDMPGLSGVDIAARLTREGIAVVFVTAHAQHAVAAFDVGAVDYVMKPIDAERLTRAIERVRARLPRVEGPIAIPGGRGLRLVSPEEVWYAEVDESGVAVHTASGVVHTDRTLADLERLLPPGAFVRVHRRVLVSLAQIEWLEPGDGGATVRLRDGTRLPVSRAAGRALRKRLG